MHRFLPALALAALVASPAHAQGTRDVSYTDRAIVSVQTKVRFTTLIILPDADRILDIICGDKDFWIVSGADNIAYVKPARTGATTNLNLITETGRVYSFLLTEGASDPDLKLYVNPDDIAARKQEPRRYYAAADVEAFRQDATSARQEAAAAKAASTRAAEDAIAQFRSSYPAQLQFPYRFRAHERPFFVDAIYTDGQFTYIRANAPELPALYELRDNAASLVSFQVDRGLFIVPKVLQSGYLALGKARLYFGLAR
jgi:type IV secretory pathway VirB9-like protein